MTAPPASAVLSVGKRTPASPSPRLSRRLQPPGVLTQIVSGGSWCCAEARPPPPSELGGEPPARPRPPALRRRRARPTSLFPAPVDSGASSSPAEPGEGAAETPAAGAGDDGSAEEAAAPGTNDGSTRRKAAAGKRRAAKKPSRRPKSYDQIKHLFEIKEPAWYTLLCIPGSEELVARDFEIAAEENAEDFGRVSTLVPLRKLRLPTEPSADANGAVILSVQQQVQSEGYIYVFCERMSDVIVGIVDDIPRAAGLVKERMRMQRSKFAMIPKPVSNDEIAQILALHEKSKTIVEEDYFVFVGCAVEVIAGPFKGFRGQVVEVDHDRQTAKALLHMFGRETPAQLAYAQLRPSHSR